MPSGKRFRPCSPSAPRDIVVGLRRMTARCSMVSCGFCTAVLAGRIYLRSCPLDRTAGDGMTGGLPAARRSGFSHCVRLADDAGIFVKTDQSYFRNGEVPINPISYRRQNVNYSTSALGFSASQDFRGVPPSSLLAHKALGGLAAVPEDHVLIGREFRAHGLHGAQGIVASHH